MASRNRLPTERAPGEKTWREDLTDQLNKAVAATQAPQPIPDWMQQEIDDFNALPGPKKFYYFIDLFEGEPHVWICPISVWNREGDIGDSYSDAALAILEPILEQCHLVDVNDVVFASSINESVAQLEARLAAYPEMAKDKKFGRYIKTQCQ